MKHGVTGMLVLLLIGLSWLDLLDRYSAGYSEGALTQAAATFALARGLNGAISVLQSTEISFNLLGGVSVTVGEVLDPLNDLIERFSWVALAAMASLGIQKLLLSVSSSLGFKLLLTLFGLGLLGAGYWRRRPLLDLMLKGFAVALFLRFAVGLTVTLNHWTEEAFLQQSRQQATEQLERTRELFEQYQDRQPADDQRRDESWWQEMKSRWSLWVGSDPFSGLEQQVEQSTRSVVDLIVVFLAQTLLFPLLFLWLLYRLGAWVWRGPAPWTGGQARR